mmetsp:Transcript_24955/g.75160  ORF Transcript_24955/g.75160 Transcript_24955/m.75160 type:complete len:339 (-) Transcript_24955:688-1704(-)
MARGPAALASAGSVCSSRMPIAAASNSPWSQSSRRVFSSRDSQRLEPPAGHSSNSLTSMLCSSSFAVSCFFTMWDVIAELARVASSAHRGSAFRASVMSRDKSAAAACTAPTLRSSSSTWAMGSPVRYFANARRKRSALRAGGGTPRAIPTPSAGPPAAAAAATAPSPPSIAAVVAAAATAAAATSCWVTRMMQPPFQPEKMSVSRPIVAPPSAARVSGHAVLHSASLSDRSDDPQMVGITWLVFPFKTQALSPSVTRTPPQVGATSSRHPPDAARPCPSRLAKSHVHSPSTLPHPIKSGSESLCPQRQDARTAIPSSIHATSSSTTVASGYSESTTA